jgi:hypothetical protein
MRLQYPPGTNIVSCLASEIQWDPDALLVISFVTLTVVYPLPASQALDVQTTYVAEYTPTQGYCQSVDFCGDANTLVILYDQYAYDCSNVYCGEHATRDCSGNYQSVACSPQGTVVPEIPTLAQVSCERALAEMSDTDRTACSPTCCQFDPTTVQWYYTCQPICVGCIPTTTGTNDDNSCFQSTLSRYFGELVKEAIRVCFTDDEGNTLCQSKWFGPLAINYYDEPTPFLSYTVVGCTAEYNGQDCESCTPCGVSTLRLGENFNLAIECSTIQAGSRYNGCDQTATGLWDFFNEVDSSLCPSPSSPTTPTANGCTPEMNNSPSAGATLFFATTTAALVVTTMGVLVVASF